MIAFYKNHMPKILVTLALLTCIHYISASPMYDKALKAFMENKPDESIPLFEIAANEASVDEKLYIYLGIAYQQVSKWDESILAFRKGLSKASVPVKYQLLFNIANSLYALGRNNFAIEYYDQAINEKADFAPAYLNRANTKMRLGNTQEAILDYKIYLSLEPSSPQRDEIQRLIAFITSKAIADAQQKADAEARRIAEEQAKQALKDSVAKSLLEASGSTQNLSAGSGALQGYSSESKLDD